MLVSKLGLDGNAASSHVRPFSRTGTAYLPGIYMGVSPKGLPPRPYHAWNICIRFSDGEFVSNKLHPWIVTSPRVLTSTFSTIHLYFSLAQLSESFVELVYPSSCTQCQYGNFSSNRLGKNKGYMPVQHSEETQQLYTDDQLTTGRSSLGDCPPRPSHEVA